MDESMPLIRKTFHSECLLEERPFDFVIGLLEINFLNNPIQLFYYVVCEMFHAGWPPHLGSSFLA
jgi:hypothetical protein